MLVPSGETAPQVLKKIGTDYVVIIHSRTSWLLSEKLGEDINKKAKAILLTVCFPIICCGESLETYEAGKAAELMVQKFQHSWLQNKWLSTVIATIWAIGTVNQLHKTTLKCVRSCSRRCSCWLWSRSCWQARVQYGGSVKPGVAEYMARRWQAVGDCITPKLAALLTSLNNFT